MIERWATPKHPANQRGWNLLRRAAKMGSNEAKLRVAKAVADLEIFDVPPAEALGYARDAAAANLEGAAAIIPDLEAQVKATPPRAP